jgi:hypothetical protein
VTEVDFTVFWDTSKILFSEPSVIRASSVSNVRFRHIALKKNAILYKFSELICFIFITLKHVRIIICAISYIMHSFTI